MNEIREIRDAMSRLSCIGRTRFHYDSIGRIFGDGEIHYLIEVSGLFFVAWKDNDTEMMIVNPITRFGLAELGELGAEEAWTVLRVPDALAEGIQFRDINDVELVRAYRRMEGQARKGRFPPYVGTLPQYRSL
jgi:hypothetical protein